MNVLELKDQILKKCTNIGMSFSVDIYDYAKEFNTDTTVIAEILDQLERMGFLKQTKCMGGYVLVNLTIDAFDFINRGGFLVQEELLKANIQKLGLEIDLLCKELSPNLLEKAHKISAIGASIASALKIMA